MLRTAFQISAFVLGATASAQFTELVSVASNGSPADGWSYYPALSSDGGYVAFQSDATNLVPGDTNLERDVFVRDRQAGATQRVSVSSGGIQANGSSGVSIELSMTPDGRYIVFDSAASNLVAGDTNGVPDVFLRDRVTGTTQRVSVGAGGAQANAQSRLSRPSISADGRYVVFSSSASNLVAGDTNGQEDVFVRDRVAGTTERVSLGVGGVQGLAGSWLGSISSDGRYVVFSSYANNLVPGDTTSGFEDLFVRDRQTGAFERVSVATNGAQANGPCQQGQISADGRYVIFSSNSTTLAGEPNFFFDVFLRDRVLGTTTVVNVDSNGVQGNGGGLWPSMSPDGRYVAFMSESSNLAPNDTNGAPDIFRRDLQTGATILSSVTTAGLQADNGGAIPAITADGRYVAFYSLATNLVPGDTNGASDIFLRYTPAPPPPPPDNDACISPQVIAGIGTFAFDTTFATTGIEGQTNSGCGAGIARDVWFAWTADFGGTAQVSLCNQTAIDSKIAVYEGSACPSAAALACNNNACSVQSSLCFPTTTGGVYLIQLGSSPSSSGGTGTFTIAQSSTITGACAPIDDGSAETAGGYFDATGGSTAWLQRFGVLGQSTTVSAIASAWGSALFPTSSPPNGSPVQVAIWDDPNDDGNPIDCVLLQLVSGTLAGASTDALQSFALDPPVTVDGYFFVGAGLAHATSRYPIPVDLPMTCAGFGRAWSFGCFSGSTLDFANLGANQFPPVNLNNVIGLSGQLLVRATCGGTTVFCVPLQAGVIGCPCSNPGQPGRGCDNSDATGGAVLNETGNPSLASDTLVFTTTGEKTTAVSVVLQGSQATATGAVFGQGVRCTAGSLKRLYIKIATAGSITAPEPGDPSVSAQSAALGDPLTPGTTRSYQVYYRDPIVLGGCPAASTFNITQGQQLTWM